ncbi:MAG: Na/Pi cotransporter family protein [Deltaproteobacteria bacterium]|nr:Na/Pi cotransporter family protein [Deltaproteobacteria bacterium]
MGWQQVVTVLGGLGLFLLGMGLMTEGLTAVSGDALRRAMRGLTGSRMRAFGLGAATTALVQSSSATTLVAIGFVGAGLLDLPAALAVVLGANVGTTSTAWIVSTIGLKVKASAFALPLIAFGAGWRLFRPGRRAVFGHALAGFGLVFLGIGTMQEGMAAVPLGTDVAGTASGIGGRATLVLIGTLMTVVAQSSSAAVAITITAVASGSIDLGAAAALVIGQNVGTTVTALIGAIGGGLAVRRAALGHVLFNVIAGAIAFAFLGPAVDAVDALASRWLARDPAVELALFHSAFNIVGVALVLPALGPFARLIERLIPAPSTGRHRLELTAATRSLPTVALEMARHELVATLAAATELASSRLDTVSGAKVGHRSESEARAVGEIAERAHEAAQFLAALARTAPQGGRRGEIVPLMHAVDHLLRLAEALTEAGHDAVVGESATLRAMAHTAAPELSAASVKLQQAHAAGVVAEVSGGLAAASRQLAEARKVDRQRVLEEVALGERPAEAADARLAAARLIDRLGYHSWRAADALRESAVEAGPRPESAGEDPSR